MKLTPMEKTLDRLAGQFPKYGISTDAPRAPWNRTGRRVWSATDVRGRVVATAFRPDRLARKLERLNA